MRTLDEIIESAKSNKETTHEECLYAMLVLERLLEFDSRTVRNLDLEKLKIPGWMDFIKNESFSRQKRTLNKSPKEWLGWNYDPRNPEYQKARQTNVKLFKTIMEKSDDKKDS